MLGFNKKSEQKRIAKQHYRNMKKYYTYTKESVFNSLIFDEYYEEKAVFTKYPNTEIQVFEMSPIRAIKMYHSYSNDTAILNFANFRKPGGGYLSGSTHQEEVLCLHSNLYNILNQMKRYYRENRWTSMSRRAIAHRGLYTPGVIFDDQYKVNVLTVAAPKICDDTIYNLRLLEERVDLILQIAYATKQKTLILGEFGCEVSGQKPNLVASVFKSYLQGKYANVFKKVIFAIPYDPMNNNYQAFYNTFNKH